MSSPNGSIANLAVTRKTLAGGTARSRIRALFELRRTLIRAALLAPCAGNAAMMRIVQEGLKIKKPALSKAPASARCDCFRRASGDTGSPDYFWIWA
jgi:hypothetical protein